jgi:hypothetical protein
MEIPERELLHYIGLRKILERTSNYKVYIDTNKKIQLLLEPFGGKEAEKEFFKIYSQTVDQRPHYQ